MPKIFLSPASISYLTQLIMTAVITGYLWYVAGKSQSGQNSGHLTFLAGAFSAFTAATFLFFLNVSLAPNLRFFTLPLDSLAVGLFVILLLQFAYRFPAPGHEREARIALGVTGLYALWEVWIAVGRYTSLAQGQVRYRPEEADIPLVLAFLWLVVVFFRQAARASTNDGPAGWWRNLWRPQTRPTRPALAMAWLSLAALTLAALDLLLSYQIISYDTTVLVQSLGILFTLSAFALVYFNYLHETSSFLAKLVGATLAVILSILGAVGWISSHSYKTAYRNDNLIAAQQTLRFTPNSQGGYDVAEVVFGYKDDFDVVLDGAGEWVDLEFGFPFYERIYHRVFVLQDGVISFGKALNINDVEFRYGSLPAIFPLHLDLEKDPAAGPGESGLYIGSTEEGLKITWYHLREIGDPDAVYTFQLSLYPDGEFELTYQSLPDVQTYNIKSEDSAWLIGVLPGSWRPQPEHISFTSDLPHSGGSRGLVEDHSLDYRRYSHTLFLPLVYFILASSAFVMIVLPTFLHLNLVRPLNVLISGVKRVNQGNLDAEVEVLYDDEIGFLADSFNQMATSILETRAAFQEANLKLEAQIIDRTSRLEEAQQISNSIIENMTEGLVIDDEEEGIVAVNPALELMLGYDPGVMLGMKSFELVAPEHRARVAEINQRRQRGVTEPYEIKLIRKDGSSLLVFIIGAPRYKNGEFAGTIALIVPHDNHAGLEAAMHKERLLSEALHSTTAVLASNLTLEEIADKLLLYVRQAIPHDSASIMMLEEEAGIVDILRAHDYANMAPDPGTRLKKFSLDNLGIIRLMTRTKQPVLVKDTRHDRRWVPADVGNIRSYLGAPMLLKGKVVGFINLNAAKPGSFSEVHADRLQTFANQASVAVENARLQNAERNLAVLEERQRLARDLHDGISQTLFSISMISDALPSLLARDAGKAHKKMSDLRSLALGAVSEMRALLLELRPKKILDSELGDLLRQLCDAAAQRCRGKISCKIEGTPYRLPPEVHISFYRISQEALNNIVRHARSKDAHITLDYRPQRVEMRVQDAGGGFNLDDTRSGHFGLQIMREHAAEIDATLEIASQVGEGTTVTTAWQITSPEETEL